MDIMHTEFHVGVFHGGGLAIFLQKATPSKLLNLRKKYQFTQK